MKHYENCEQLFVSVGKCYVIEALLEFFQMADTKHKPTANSPHSVYSLTEAYRSSYLGDVIEKFLDEYVFVDDNDEDDAHGDGVWCYAVNLVRSFLLWQILRMLWRRVMVSTFPF